MNSPLSENTEFKASITLLNIKKVKDNIGHDKNRLYCDLCLKSKVILSFADDGWGGRAEYDFSSDTNEQYLLAFIKEHNLAQIIFDNGYDFMDSVDKITPSIVISEIVNQLYNLKVQEKDAKKITKLCSVAIVFGDGGFSYSYYGYKNIKSLNEVSKESLQKTYDNAIKALAEGEKILNSSEQLQSLGIKLAS
jgi:hypothetical protein